LSDQERDQEKVLLTSSLDFPVTVGALEAPDEDTGPGDETFETDRFGDKCPGERELVRGRFKVLSTSSALLITFENNHCSPCVLGMHHDSPSVYGIQNMDYVYTSVVIATHGVEKVHFLPPLLHLKHGL